MYDSTARALHIIGTMTVWSCLNQPVTHPSEEYRDFTSHLRSNLLHCYFLLPSGNISTPLAFYPPPSQSFLIVKKYHQYLVPTNLLLYSLTLRPFTLEDTSIALSFNNISSNQHRSCLHHHGGLAAPATLTEVIVSPLWLITLP